MRLVGLISGGKDSIFNMLQCISAGHEISAVANIEPEHKVELDSYMYQSVGHEALTLIAGALSLPIYRYKTKGKAICLDKVYVPTPNDEVEDLYELLKTVKKEMNIEGVSVGAIASDYQRTRVENVCHRLNLRCFAFLWRRDQAELLQEMIDSELDAIIIKVASIGLDPKVHLGMHVTDLKDNLMELNRKFGVNICGEGGEYETLTLDCPLFHRAIDITDVENVILSDAAFAPVGFLNIKGAELKVKVSRNDDPVKSSQARLEHIRTVVKNPYYYVQDCLDTITAYYFEEERWKIIVEILEQIFPDGRNVDSSIEEIPFPFHTPPKPSDTLTSISGYWKKGEPSHVSSSLQGMTSKSSVAFPTTSSSLIYSTGWCCIGNIVSASGAEALSLLKKHLERINYTFEDIVFVNVFLRDMNEFSNFNKIYSNFMPDISPPSRVCVGTQLPSNVGIIMLVVAHKLVSRSQKALHSAHVLEKEVMHVQSISNWAPANIGPYSQCVKIGEIYYLAGQIPLVPGTMEIFNKPLYHQCLLALRHVVRVLEAMHEQFSYSNILQAICYVVSESLASDVNSLWSYIAKNRNATVTALVVKDLPRKAQLEWEVIACGSKDLQAKEVTQTTEDFIIQMKHCICAESPALSFMCKVSFPKRINKDEKNLKIITESGIQTVINICIQQAKSEFKHFESFLCILKLYYKCNETILGPVIRNVVKLYFDSKVVLTAIPVISCEEPDVILTITGICH